jgi:hypothetical protein
VPDRKLSGLRSQASWFAVLLVSGENCTVGLFITHIGSTMGVWPLMLTVLFRGSPDGIGWQGFYMDHHQKGGICLPWTSSRAATGRLTCELYTCVNPKTGLPSATAPRGNFGYKHYTLGCKPPGILPYKGVCDKTDNKAFCDKSGAPSVCLKAQIVHVDQMSRSAGILMEKRSSCDSRTGKCSVFKSGLCIDVRKNVWTSTYNTHHQVASISDVNGGMIKQAKRFGKEATRLLKKYKNKLPKKHRCSDHRHKFVYQLKGRRKWHSFGGRTHKDATLARFAIPNF